jgi:hypothetical protein
MENSPQQEVPELFRQALAHLRGGRPEAARILLIHYVRNNPNSEAGWYLLSLAVTAPREQMDCLRQVLRLNRRHPEALERLRRLTEPVEPAPTIAEPEVPAGEAVAPAPASAETPRLQESADQVADINIADSLKATSSSEPAQIPTPELEAPLAPPGSTTAVPAGEAVAPAPASAEIPPIQESTDRAADLDDVDGHARHAHRR